MSKLTTAQKLQKKYHDVQEVTTLKQLLYRSANRYANRNAFRLKDSTGTIYGVTYDTFQKDVIALGTSLLESGLQNEKIAVIGKNSYQWAVSYLASTIVGVVVPIDKELHVEDVINFLNLSDAKAILGDQKYLELIQAHKQKLQNPSLLLINFNQEKDIDSLLSYSRFKQAGSKQLEEGDTRFDKIEIDPDEMRILLFTSGTTGKAKGVCLSHRNICSNILSTYGIVKVRRNDQVLSILPLHHTYECTLGYLLVIYSGGCISYCEGLRYINQNISEFKPSVILCVPLLLEKMYKKIETTVKKNLPANYTKEENFISKLPSFMKIIVKRKVKNSLGGRIKKFIVGAAPLNSSIVESFLSLGIKPLQGYGLTECSPLVAGNNDFYLKPEAVGLPIPNVTYKIVNPDEHGVGEIIVKGPSVMLGYYNNPEETEKVLKDGWFYTGDLGRIDEQGWLYITGRCKTVIIAKNGENIYPEELETYLNSHPLISESLVTGLNYENNDEVYVNAQILPNMEAIKEYLKVSVPQKEEIKTIMSEVIANINKKLPNYKHIKSFKVREEDFEKTTTQKIKRYGNNMEKQEQNKKEKSE